MYQSDSDVEKDVALLRRRLKEEPVERQVQVRTHSTRIGEKYGQGELTWWVVSVPGKAVNSNWVWFAFDRNSQGKLEVRERANKVEVVATVDTVDAAIMAGMVAIERPS